MLLSNTSINDTLSIINNYILLNKTVYFSANNNETKNLTEKEIKDQQLVIEIKIQTGVVELLEFMKNLNDFLITNLFKLERSEN